jgi:protein-S-isoprenylcysteine O-methyltransferase Ste14
MTETLDNLVHEYLERFSEPREKSWKEKIMEYYPTYNPELTEVVAKTIRNRHLLKKFDENIESEEDEAAAILYAKKEKPSYQSGLALGYLFPDAEITEDTSEFDKGMKKGQVYRLKMFGNKSRRTVSRGLLVLVGSQAANYFAGPYQFREENFELIQSGSLVNSAAIAASLLYGLYPMIRNNLFSNDANLSHKLVTDGQFALHRNPFYAGLMSAALCFTASVTATHALSENPEWHVPAIAALGLGMFLKGINDYAKNDEEVLEKQFGDEYREYKKRTPRFIPKISNLWRKRK